MRASGCTGASHTRGQDANDTQSINKPVKKSAQRMYWVLNGHLGHGRDCVGVSVLGAKYLGQAYMYFPDVGWSRQVAQNVGGLPADILRYFSAPTDPGK